MISRSEAGTGSGNRRLTHYALLSGHAVAVDDARVYTDMPEKRRGSAAAGVERRFTRCSKHAPAYVMSRHLVEATVSAGARVSGPRDMT